ncbi:Druantia anti-phage system protein DruA [Roseomonas mucosa]
MAADETLHGAGRQRVFSPYLAPGERDRLHDVLDPGNVMSPSFANELRALARRFVDDGDSLKLRAILLLVADLHEQGWQIDFARGRITFAPPGLGREQRQTVDEVKERVRAALQIARQRQLAEPSVRQFLARMERRTPRPAGRFSVLDLIDDGAELARAFRRIGPLGDADRDAALAALIDPVVEICETGAKCADTGIGLTDIWRYFRHTWAHEYRAIPGRQMMVLIRNAARPRRPIMGIAMLASPVMRLACRDEWIGWLRGAAGERLASGAWDHASFAHSLAARVDTSINNIRWDDLATAEEIGSFSEALTLRLEQRAAGATHARDAQLRTHSKQNRDEHGRVRPHRGDVRIADETTNWTQASEDLLFVRKRAEGLAQLLATKRVFASVDLLGAPEQALPEMLATPIGQRALDIALAEFRKAGLSSQVADVSVCGAVHPYNQLLGGKLVALLLASREVADAYARRYGGQVSVIASQMAGRAISKPADLRILTTTSLYGVGSSQYNRLALSHIAHPELQQDLRWDSIGRSLTGGFGTLHLGAETAQALRGMAVLRHDARRVNNRFGEGTSPRLRQIREGLDALGLKSDAILHHANPRLFYGCELDANARGALVGMATVSVQSPQVRDIAAAWRRRWLSARVGREETLAKLAYLGPNSVWAALHADADGQLRLPIDGA